MKPRSIVLLIPVFLLLPSCNNSDDEGRTPFLTESSDLVCKSFLPLKGNQPGPGLSCVDYSYDGDSILTLSHLNSAFNCCPEDILVEFEIKGDSILITEDDKEELCKCNCLFDVEIKLHNIGKDKYHVRFKEPYVFQDSTRMTFPIDLENEPVGRFCVKRTYYPWRE